VPDRPLTSAPIEPRTVSGVIRWTVLHPWDALGKRWNYKSAVLSSVVRALLFSAVNDRAGRDAALAAMTTEFCFRFATSGLLRRHDAERSSRRALGRWHVAAMIVLPVEAHSLEAMASGVPVVVPDTGGVLEHASSANAWLAEPTTVAFAAAIRAARRGDPARIAAAAETASRFRWQEATRRYLAAYDEIYRRFTHTGSTSAPAHAGAAPQAEVV